MRAIHTPSQISKYLPERQAVAYVQRDTGQHQWGFIGGVLRRPGDHGDAEPHQCLPLRRRPTREVSRFNV